MANFKPTAYRKIEKNEGGWVDNPKDTGGETWKGVARKKNPNWSGWKIIDELKRLNPKSVALAYAGKPATLNAVLRSSVELEQKVVTFYQLSYWDINRLSEIKDQQLADNVCDCGVNCGTKTAAKMLQRVVGVKNDGVIGPKTLASVNAGDAKSIYTQYNAYRKQYYDGLIAYNPDYKEFKDSWYSRLVPYKD